jgi:hypothetical protein
MTVLTLALILGSISVASAASGKGNLTDIADNANAEAIQVTYDLGIVTGTPEGAYEPEKAVNRAEFAALITRALAIPESALSYYSTTTFKDTSGYGWAVPYLAILQQRGIMKGDGYGNAMPGRTISPNEAITMVLRAVGYTDNASVLVGQWPANYVALGQSQNLYAKVANDLQMNKASAAQMVYNVLTTQLVQVDANSTVKYLYDADSNATDEAAWQTLLTTSLNCETSGKKIVTYGDAAKSKIDLIPNVGAYGTLYTSKADGEVVALTSVGTQFISGRFMFKGNGLIDVFQSTDGTKYTLSTDAPKDNVSPSRFAQRFNPTSGAITVPADTKTAIFLNGEQTSLSKAQADKYVVEDPDGPTDLGYGTTSASNVPYYLTIAAKVNGLTITDLRTVAVWVAKNDGDFIKGDNFLYESGQIDGTKFNGHNFPLDVNNEVDHTGYLITGVDSVTDIAADNVVYIYKNRVTDKITRIDVGTATQSGTITNINKADFARTIGGTVLYEAPYSGHGIAGIETAGNEGTALLDIYGRIYDFQLGEASKGNFAVYLGQQPAFTDIQVKIYDKTGSEVIYTVTDSATKARILGTAPWTTPLSVGTLIEYKISGSKISEVVKAVSAPAPTNVTGKVNSTGTILTTVTVVSPGPPAVTSSAYYLVDSGLLVYLKDGNSYNLGSIKDLKDIDNPFLFIEGATSKKVGALIVEAGDAGAQSVFVMLNSTSVGWDNGDIDVVSGLSFADGATAGGKSWNYTDDRLVSSVLSTYPGYVNGTNNRGRYDMMVKFRIDEAGVLKNAVNLNTLTDKDNPTNPVKIGSYKSWNPGGSDGSFSITSTVGGVETLIAFEANSVLYKVSGGSWTAMRPTAGNFQADNGTGTYTFLKTDLSKAYDVIIKQP